MADSKQADTQDTAPVTDNQPASQPTPVAEAEPVPAPESAKSADVTDNALAGQLAAARKEAADHHDRYLRALADIDNIRRRVAREKEDLRQFAAARVLEDLLPVLDNLSLGLVAAKAPNADLTTLVGGIGMVFEQFKAAAATHGLKEINPAGATFDPNLHEALSQQPSADVAEGQVLQVIRVGYTLNGRLLRPASVVISSGPAKEANKS